MKNILITGATGFIGKHLLKRLTELGNCNITVLLRKSSKIDLINDYKDKNVAFYYHESNYESIDLLFKDGDFDHVFHLASISRYDCESQDVSNMIDSNIKLGTFILEAMKKYGCKNFINTSTYWQNYKTQSYEPICLYAATKKAFEDIIEYYCLNGIRAISLKLYDVYGYDDHRNKLLNSLIKLDGNKEINLTKGEQKIYMVFIDDVIDAYLKAMIMVDTADKHTTYGVFNDNEKYSLKEIVKMIEKLTNKKLNINWGQRQYNKFQIMDSVPVEKLPTWTAKTTLNEGTKIILKKEHGQ